MNDPRICTCPRCGAETKEGGCEACKLSWDDMFWLWDNKAWRCPDE